jgi:hypothetical protein
LSAFEKYFPPNTPTIKKIGGVICIFWILFLTITIFGQFILPSVFLYRFCVGPCFFAFSLLFMLAPFLADKKKDLVKTYPWYGYLIFAAIMIFWYSAALAVLAGSVFAMWNPEWVASHAHSGTSSGHSSHIH